VNHEKPSEVVVRRVAASAIALERAFSEGNSRIPNFQGRLC
jgi:hypothetical protein